MNFLKPTMPHVGRSSNTGFMFDVNPTSSMHIQFPPSLPLPPIPTKIVAIGGLDPLHTTGGAQESSRQVERYNPRTNSWHVLPSLPEARHHHGVAAIDSSLYVVGMKFLQCICLLILRFD